MKKLSSIFMVTALLAAFGVAAGPANADLLARGAVIPAHGYPAWYQDFNGLALSLCLDQTPIGGVPGPTACVLEPNFDPDPAVADPTLPAAQGGRVGPVLPITTDRTLIAPDTFPGEAFYFMAGTSGASPGGGINVILYEAAVEAGFAPAVLPAVDVDDGNQAVFTRIRVRANVTQIGTYTMTHPYGVETFIVDAIVPGPEINFTNDIPGLVIGAFDVPVNAIAAGFPPPYVGPIFLTNANGTLFTHPVTGDRYIGDNATPVTVTGGLNGINSVTITGPAGTFLSDTFVLTGKVFGIEITPPAEGNDFGTWHLNATSPDRTYTVTNFTGAPATIAPLLNSNPTPFIIDAGNDNCSNAVLTAVAPGNTCTFAVRFSPDAEGVVSSTITAITANAPSVTLIVTGAGDGIVPVLAVPDQFARLTATIISGTASDNFGVPTVQVSLNGTIQGTATVTNGAWSLSVGPLTPNTVNNISVTATDGAQPAPGNQTIVTATVTHDNELPVVSLTAPSDALVINNPTLQALTFTATDLNLAATVVMVDGAIVTPVPATLGALTDGTHTVSVETTDSAGNVSVALNNITVALTNGDIDGNGTVTIADPLQALRVAVGLVPQPTAGTVPFFHGDVAPLGSPNGTVDIADALLILRKVVGLETSF